MVDPQPHTDPDPDVAGYLLGTLDEAEAVAFAEHLSRCEACRSELAELARLPGLLAQAPPAEVLPAGLEERTFAAIEAAATEANSMSQPEPGRHEPGPPAAVIPIEKARRDRGRGPARVIMAVAAAVVVVAIGVGVATSVGKGSQAPVATIQLISATGGPAHATATIRTSPAGLTVDMEVDGLAPNPPGTMYTCWLVGPGDTIAHQNRVSVGSFVVRSNQAVHVHWTTAADRSRFPHMGVTIEPINGNPRHQGPKVLAGP
jgi:anti-sigma-K factor RskA